LRSYLAPRVLFPITCSRGCYWRKCSFCNISRSTCPTFKLRSLERVESDLAYLEEKFGARDFYFSDNAIPPKYLPGLTRYFRSRENLATWTGMMRMERSITTEMLVEACGAGFRLVMFGQESGNQRVLDMMRKGISLAVSERLIRDAAQAGMLVTLMNIVGFPTETGEEAEDTLRFILANREHLFSAHVSSYLLMRDSPLHERFANFGLSDLKISDAREIFPTFRYSTSLGMSQDESAAKYEEIRSRLFYVFPWTSFFIDTCSHALMYFSEFGPERFRQELGSLVAVLLTSSAVPAEVDGERL
jgi:anaerobic magnesium-protoporphyrin IX monomethyl ester cyclase